MKYTMEWTVDGVPTMPFTNGVDKKIGVITDVLRAVENGATHIEIFVTHDKAE